MSVIAFEYMPMLPLISIVAQIAVGSLVPQTTTLSKHKYLAISSTVVSVASVCLDVTFCLQHEKDSTFFAAAVFCFSVVHPKFFITQGSPQTTDNSCQEKHVKGVLGRKTTLCSIPELHRGSFLETGGFHKAAATIVWHILAFGV